MTNNRINKISAESIQDIDDVKTWARDHEIGMDLRTKDMQVDIRDLQKRDDELQKGVSRSIKLLMITSIIFVVVLGVIVILSGVVHIVPMVKGMF